MSATPSLTRSNPHRSNPLTRLAVLLLLIPLGHVLQGCQEPLSEAQRTPIRAMRFAGVDAKFALRRVAAEANMVLALDEIQPLDGAPDMAFYRVDVDLPAGTLQEAMETLQKAVNAFDFEIRDKLIYVRSELTIKSKTILDVPFVPPMEFDGNLQELTTNIAKLRPDVFMAYVPSRVIVPDKASLLTKETLSPIEVLLRMAEASGVGWRLGRAGELVEQDEKSKTIAGSALTPWPKLDISTRVPILAQDRSTLMAIADVARRLESPMLVLDRTVWMDLRGGLNYSGKLDPALPMEESLELIKFANGPAVDPVLEYEFVDGVPILRSRLFLSRLQGRDFLRAKLKAGTFEGSLPELARWINANYQEKTERYLMAGEISPDEPRYTLQIPEGATPLDVLRQFTKQSKTGIYLSVIELTDPIKGQPFQHPRLWHGAFLQHLDEWSSARSKERI